MKGEYISSQDLAPLISTEIYLCDNRSGSETQSNASEAYDYFLLKPKGDEIEGRSQVQDGAVTDVIDATMAELQPMYSVDELVQIEPEGPQDEERAAAETKAINWYFRERARGFEKLDDCVQDALLLRNGYIKCWPESSWQLPYEETVEGTRLQVEAQLAQYQQQGQVRINEERSVQEAQIQTDYVLADDGLSQIPVEVEVAPEIVSVDVTIIPKKREIRIETVAREDIGVSRDCFSSNLQTARFVFHRRKETRNEFMSLGFYRDDVKNLTKSNDTDTEIQIARQEGSQRYNETTAADDGGDLVTVYEVYYKIDADGDGIAELHQVFYGNGRVMRWANEDGSAGEYADQIVRVCPIAAGIALRVAHRHLGRSLFDKEKQQEDVKRELTRQMLDNVRDANDKEFIIGPGASVDDFESGFSGGYKRCRNPQTDAVPVPYQPIINESLQALAYMDKVRKERGGGAVDSGTQEQPVNINSSVFERHMTAMEKPVAMYARNIANTVIRDTFVLLHAQLRTLGEDIQFKDGDKWTMEQPRHWIERERFSVKMGKTEGEKGRMVAAFDKTIALQQQDMQSGGDGILVDWQKMYEARTDQARIMGLVNPDQYWVDPSSEQGQMAAQQKSQSAQQAAQAAQAQQDKMLEAQMSAVAMQEETKRLSDAVDAQQKSLDRIADYITEMTKIEAETGQDIEGGVLIGDEGVSVQ